MIAAARHSVAGLNASRCGEQDKFVGAWEASCLLGVSIGIFRCRWARRARRERARGRTRFHLADIRALALERAFAGLCGSAVRMMARRGMVEDGGPLCRAVLGMTDGTVWLSASIALASATGVRLRSLLENPPACAELHVLEGNASEIVEALHTAAAALGELLSYQACCRAFARAILRGDPVGEPLEYEAGSKPARARPASSAALTAQAFRSQSTKWLRLYARRREKCLAGVARPSRSAA